jgi:hypothetical protein
MVLDKDFARTLSYYIKLGRFLPLPNYVVLRHVLVCLNVDEKILDDLIGGFEGRYHFERSHEQMLCDHLLE